MSLRSKMMYNQSTLLTSLVVLVLILSILNCFTIYRLEQKFEGEEVIDLYNPNAIRDLKGRYFLNADKFSSDIYRASKGMDYPAFYRKVKMEAFCGLKERIGEIDDGGKYVCNPKMVRKENCTLISLGLHDMIMYDQHITNVTGRRCMILGADKDAQQQTTQEAYQKLNGELFVGMIPNELTISSMMQKAERTDVDILKIDIEGGEHEGLEPFLKDYNVCQILIEVHGTPAKHLEMLQKMGKYNFRIFNVDPNPYCINCCEYSLINENCMDQYGVAPLVPIIPRSEY